MPENKIEPFHIPKSSIENMKPVNHCIGIENNGFILLHCIGSGDTFRDAKACAIKNIKSLLSKLKKLEENV